MRFCPFCAQENADAASECAHCGRKLPQLAGTPRARAAFPATSPVTPPPRRAPRPIPRTRPVTPLPASEMPEKRVYEAPVPVETHGSARARSGTLLGIPAADASAMDLPTQENVRLAPEELTAAETTMPSPRLDSAGYSSGRAGSEPVSGLELPVDTEVQLPALPSAIERPVDDVRVTPMPSAPSGPAADVEEPVAMPAHPGQGVLAAVKYLVPLAQAVWARHKAQEQLRSLLHDDQRRVDEALRDLGDAAWQMRPRLPELRGELDRADEDEARRRAAEQELARLDMSVTAEKERFAADGTQREASIATHEAEVARLGEDLAERRRVQKSEDKVLRDAEARLRAAAKIVHAREHAALKAEQAPADKGGGPDVAARLREEAAAAQEDVHRIRIEVDEQTARARALDAPIADLEVEYAAERGTVAAETGELEAARRAHADELARLEVARDLQIDTREVAERAVRLRLVSTGTLLSLHRVDGQAHQMTFAPIYARLDGLQGVASARDARIGVLEAERHGYDRAALQRGLIAVGGALGACAIVLVVIILLLASTHQPPPR